jgi:hypothetical protein
VPLFMMVAVVLQIQQTTVNVSLTYDISNSFALRNVIAFSNLLYTLRAACSFSSLKNAAKLQHVAAIDVTDMLRPAGRKEIVERQAAVSTVSLIAPDSMKTVSLVSVSPLSSGQVVVASYDWPRTVYGRQHDRQVTLSLTRSTRSTLAVPSHRMWLKSRCQSQTAC